MTSSKKSFVGWTRSPPPHFFSLLIPSLFLPILSLRVRPSFQGGGEEGDGERGSIPDVCERMKRSTFLQRILDMIFVTNACSFVRDEVEPLDQMGFSPYDVTHPLRAALFPPLQQVVKEKGLWACHLGPELGGPGYGQLKLALMNMILGRSKCASKIFGTAAPDTGNRCLFPILFCFVLWRVVFIFWRAHAVKFSRTTAPWSKRINT